MEDEEREEIIEMLHKKYVDYIKNQCAMCNRQFKKREVLEKHVTKSELHKVYT